MCKLLLLLMLAVLVVAGAVCTGLFFSPQGSSALTQFLLSRTFESSSVEVGEVAPPTVQGLTMKDVRLDDVRGLPEGSEVLIQIVEVEALPALPLRVRVTMHNGRLKLPESETILFYGTYQEHALDLYVYAKEVDVSRMAQLAAPHARGAMVSGALADVHVHITGSVEEPVVSAELLIDELRYKQFSLQRCPLTGRVAFSGWPDALSARGQMFFERGEIVSRDARIALEPSRLLFDGPPENPKLAVRGSARVEDVAIRFVVDGTFAQPEMRVTSTPPMSQEQALLLLATGKRWEGTAQDLSEGRLSGDTAKEFVDFLILSKVEGRLAELLRLSGVALTYDGTQVGVDVRKRVLPNVEIGAGVVKSSTGTDGGPETTSSTAVKYTLSGSSSVALEAEQTIRQPGSGVSAEGTAAPQSETREDAVKLKFKRTF